ncbi:MAG: PAS domain S-box protein [Anaerolineae bacterium]|nr:PAS domain S-box protein [Anaerolineae bacterium]
MLLDGNRRIRRFNRALAQMTGWQPDMAIGRLDSDVIRWTNCTVCPDLDAMLALDWEDHKTVYAEGDIERLDGLALSVGISYALVRKPDGSPDGIVANVRDITNFRRAEQMKDTFISVISHELKTPVALIKGYAGTLRREDAQWDRAAYDSALEVIEDEADRLTSLIENLLAASKLKAEGMRLSLGDVRLDALARQSTERFQHQTERHHLALDFPADYPVVTGDAVRLRQVIDNLLSNALKYSPEGGAVRISGHFDDQWVYLLVQDQGVGLRTDELQRIFDRFYRTDEALKRSTQGTGLGLYLARAVVEAHGGRIWAESQPNQGATFTFTIPR